MGVFTVTTVRTQTEVARKNDVLDHIRGGRRKHRITIKKKHRTGWKTDFSRKLNNGENRNTYPVRRRMAVWRMWTEWGRAGARAAHERGPTRGHVQRICTGQVTLGAQLLKNGHQFGQMLVGCGKEEERGFSRVHS